MSTFEPLTLERAKQLAAEAVALKGAEYIYTNPDGYSADGALPIGMDGDTLGELDEQCYYVHGDEPGCIAGHILHLHGVPLHVLRDHELHGADSVVADLFGVEKNSLVASYLREMQRLQDNGKTWGQALSLADCDED